MQYDFKLYRKILPTKAVKMETDFQVVMVGNVVSGKAGDYLCIDSEGNLYPCSKEVFEDSYVEVKEE